MTTRIAFLRAVNVGKRTVRMARLVELFGELGYGDAWTFINSGNVVFDATGRRTDLERTIADRLEDEYGFECTTFVRTAAELRTTLAVDTYFVTFLSRTASGATASALEELSNDMDTLVVRGSEVHWRMHGTSMETTLPKKVWERLVGVNASTSRNITMLRKLAAKIEAG